MRRAIKHFIFGSCGVHHGVNALAPLRFSRLLFAHLGFYTTPYALSAGAAVQLYDFCTGERALPEAIRKLAYLDTNQPSSETRGLVEETEIALLELSTPIEPMIGDDIVNFHRIMDFVVSPLSHAGADHKKVSGWVGALVNVRPDLAVRAADLLAAWPDGVDDDGLARFAVENLRSVRLGSADMVRALEILRDKMKVPLALKLYDFKFMPDGRPIEWPRGFKAQQLEVADTLGLAVLDLHPVVQSIGPGRLISEDDAHWQADSVGLQGELIYDFLALVLDRPPLETFPDWLDARPRLLAGQPELHGRPARLAFPGLAKLPSRSSRWRQYSSVDAEAPADPTYMGPPMALPPRWTEAERIVSRINAELVALHRRRLAEMGPTESGLYAYYEARIAMGQPVHERERAAFELLCSELPAYDRYLVIRAGIGELALLLGASGRRVVACELNGNRRQAIEAGLDHLEAMGLVEKGMVTVEAAWRPDPPLEERCIGVGLDAIVAANDVAAALLLPMLEDFEALLIEPRLFLCLRKETSDQQALARNLRAIGFSRQQGFPEDGLAFFSKGPTERPPQAKPPG